MVYLLDSNILIYAKMDGMAVHEVVSRWLSGAVSDPANTIMVCETSILSFLRITTNAKVFDPPLGFDDARIFLESFVNHPNIQIFRPSAPHFIALTDLMKKLKFGGNMVMDAYLAVLAMSTGATLVTRDRDFKKVPYLKILNP